jgi:hypothetical protein
MNPGKPVYVPFELGSDTFKDYARNNFDRVHNIAMLEIAMQIDVMMGKTLSKVAEVHSDLNTLVNFKYHAPLPNAIGCAVLNQWKFTTISTEEAAAAGRRFRLRYTSGTPWCEEP